MSDAVAAAAIATIGTLVAAGVTAWTQVYLRKHLGKTNGSGTIAHMVETDIKENVAHRTEDRILFTALFKHLQIEPPPGLLVEEVSHGPVIDR
jgi:hypothetical protein